MLKPMSVEYIENAVFGGRTKQETEKYNNYQLKGFDLYNKCNFTKELKRNIDLHIKNYTKFFIHGNEKIVTTVSPMKNSYPHAYYEHCRSYKILVDENNKCLLLINK